MGKGSSSSETSQSTSSADNRIAADGQSIVVASGGTYNNSFSDQVGSVISKVLDFSGGVVNKAGSVIDEALHGQQQANTSALQLSNQVANNAQLGQTSILTNPATLAAIVGAIGLIAYIAMRKK